MSTSKAYHHGDLRDALVKAGLTLLERGGPDGLTLRAVAAAVGVSAMAPYRHFADKAALLAGVAAAGFTVFAEALIEADAAGDDAAALVGQGRAYVAFALARPALFRLMFSAPWSGGDAALRLAGESAYAVLARRVATLAPPGTESLAALACWSLVHGLASLAVDGRLPPGAPADRMADGIVRMLLPGLTAPVPPSAAA